MEQEPYSGFHISQQEFADNPDPRVPCILLLDTSGSMSGQPITELNLALQQYRDELLTDNLASRRVEVAIFSFGGKVELAQDFVTARQFTPPTLAACGGTPMAEAIVRAIKHLQERKTTYQTHGVPYYRPWIFLITDGAPTDNHRAWELACEAVKRGEQNKMFAFFAVGTAGADFEKLRELSADRDPLQLKGMAFRDMFRWLSNSQTRVSQSQAGANLKLPPATGDGGWAEVPI